MVTRPVVVYLDTSDISRFADIGTNHERGTLGERTFIREVYDFLQRHVEQDNIEVRFSGLHIAEIAKPALQESRLQEPATRKAQVIERLCGSLCFRSFEEIWAREVWQLVGSRAVDERFAMPYEVYSNQGTWLFKSTDNLNLNVDLDAWLREHLSSGFLNRKKRRALQAQLWPDNRLSERGLELLRPHQFEVARKIASKFPVNDPHEVVDVIVRRLSGRITDAAMEKEFAQILHRPTQTLRFAFEMDEFRTRFPQIVVDFGETVVRAIEDLRARLALAPHSIKRKFRHHLADTLTRGPALEAALRRRHDIRGLRIGDEQIREIVQHAPLGDLPAVDLISTVTKAYAAQHATTEQRPKHSDGADLLHLTYLPYCDVFRADVRTAEVLRQCDLLAAAKVARRLRDLPALIERCAAQGA